MWGFSVSYSFLIVVIKFINQKNFFTKINTKNTKKRLILKIKYIHKLNDLLNPRFHEQIWELPCEIVKMGYAGFGYS